MMLRVGVFTPTFIVMILNFVILVTAILVVARIQKLNYSDREMYKFK